MSSVDKMCMLCQSQPSKVILPACGHQDLCFVCSYNLAVNKIIVCPRCGLSNISVEKAELDEEIEVKARTLTDTYQQLGVGNAATRGNAFGAAKKPPLMQPDMGDLWGLGTTRHIPNK